MSRCSVSGCRMKSNKKHPNITLHRLPTCKERKEQWLDILGIENLNTTTKHIFICSLHLEEKFFNRTLNVTRLSDNALPSSELMLNMLSRVHYLKNVIGYVEKNVLRIFGFPPRELALAYTYENRLPQQKKFSIKDIVGDGILLAVPKFRRTVEKRLKRKFGSPEYVWKMLIPKTNIIVCNDCGHYHERGYICGHCYKKVEAETKEIQDKIQEKLGNLKPIESEVIVLYNGENLPEQPKEFWRGKRIIEMKKDRPQWFSKNLLQKSTQQPSESTDVKPTDLA